MTNIFNPTEKRSLYQFSLVKLLRLIFKFISIAAICLGIAAIFQWLFEPTWLNIFSDRSIFLITAIFSLILGVISLVQDRDRDLVSKNRLETEQRLQESKAKYKAIIEEQAELICRHRPDFTISYVNEAFCRYFGIEKEQLIDREYTPVVYEADRAKVRESINLMNPDNPTMTIENRVIAKGVVRWTQWNNRMIFDEVGNFIEYQSVGRDITPLKEIELKLRESEEKFRLAFEDAATGEALVAPDGKFIQVNRSLCEIVGYSETELLSKTFQELTHPEDINLDLSYLQQMLAGEIRTYQMEKRYFHKNGYIVWVLLSVSMVSDIDNQPMYFISQIEDINQRKRAEAKLNAFVTELERSNQELDDFASVVSHDLISPLRKQLMLIDLIKEEYGAILGREGEDYLTKIVGYNSRMDSLIRSLLTYARVTTQSQPFVMVALDEVVSDVLCSLEPEITQVQAQIEVDQLPTIKGDRTQLNQLFLNLLQNALKFHNRDRASCSIALSEGVSFRATEETSATAFRATKIKLEHHLENSWHKITVSDNGIGFEPEQQLKIFNPFHRLHSPSKYSGTGLGLAICEKIVNRHQGTITAHSQPNQGATFTVCLPCDRKV